MLDTNVVSELVRRPDGGVARRAASFDPRTLAVSIAAPARALDLTLVTRNVREFERVPGLAVEDWHANEEKEVR